MTRNTPWRTARRMYALNQGRNDWYRIKNQVNGPTLLHIYDEIGYFGVSASDLVRDLADVTNSLEVHINSPGGDVDDGIAIYNTLMARNDVTVVIDGIAASIASVIAMAGSPILIARQARMMVHDGYTMAIGNAQDLRDMAEHLDKASNNIATIYAEHTGHRTDYWRGIMKAETWFDADEAVDAGLADRYLDSGAGRRGGAPTDVQGRSREGSRSGGGNSAEERWDMGIYRGEADPGSYRNRDRDAATVPYVSPHDTRHITMTGKHSHDHSSYGSDDHDDGIHSHLHEHAGHAGHNPDDTDHTHVHGPGMGNEGQEGTEGRPGFHAKVGSGASAGAQAKAGAAPSGDAGNKDHGDVPWIDLSDEEVEKFFNIKALKGA